MSRRDTPRGGHDRLLISDAGVGRTRGSAQRRDEDVRRRSTRDLTVYYVTESTNIDDCAPADTHRLKGHGPVPIDAAVVSASRRTRPRPIFVLCISFLGVMLVLNKQLTFVDGLC